MTTFILFIILGLFLSWVIKGYRRYETLAYSQKTFKNFELTQEALAKSELGLFVALCAKVAKADGKIDELEAELVGNMFKDIAKVFPDPERARDILKAIFKEEKDNKYNLDEVAYKLFGLIGRDEQKRHMMMNFLVILAYVDGHMSESEENILTKVGALLHFTLPELDAMMKRAQGMHSTATSHTSIKEAYALLGIKESDDLSTVKKAYRKLVRQYHPDIIQAQGASKEYIDESTQKVQDINAAYEMIKKAKE